MLACLRRRRRLPVIMSTVFRHVPLAPSMTQRATDSPTASAIASVFNVIVALPLRYTSLPFVSSASKVTTPNVLRSRVSPSESWKVNSPDAESRPSGSLGSEIDRNTFTLPDTGSPFLSWKASGGMVTETADDIPGVTTCSWAPVAASTTSGLGLATRETSTYT